MKTIFGDEMDITKFDDIVKFMGEVNELNYGRNTYEDIRSFDERLKEEINNITK